MEDRDSRLKYYTDKYNCESCFDKDYCHVLRDIKLGFLQPPECPRWVSIREGGI